MQARSIPWDCADWQAFAHADRTIAILESLAENRGKTLYCGIDQSDTFTKAETWAAGKDRNERDDTIYSGERGIFRGFIAAQEGWLTDGESGITGVSIDRIFEFPKEERRRTKRVKRLKVPESAAPIARAPNGSHYSLSGGSEGACPGSHTGCLLERGKFERSAQGEHGGKDGLLDGVGRTGSLGLLPLPGLHPCHQICPRRPAGRLPGERHQRPDPGGLGLRRLQQSQP